MNIKQLTTRIQHLELEIEKLRLDNERLKALVERLKKVAFGKRSEKANLLLDPNQLSLLSKKEIASLVKVVNEELDEQEEKERKKKKKGTRYKVPHAGRNKFPKHLEVVEKVIEPDVDTSNMKFFKNEITETLDFIPGKLIIVRTIRPTYIEVKKSSTTGKVKETIICAELPNRAIEKGIPESALLAHLFKSKFVDHLPFYRLAEIFKREYDYSFSRSTLSRWFAKCCKLILPIFEKVKEKILSTNYLMLDESRIKVLEGGRKGYCHEGWMWHCEDPVKIL